MIPARQPHPQPMEITSKQMARVYNAAELKVVHSIMDEIRDIYTATRTHTSPPAPEYGVSNLHPQPIPKEPSPVCYGKYTTIKKREVCEGCIFRIGCMEHAILDEKRRVFAMIESDESEIRKEAAKAAREQVLEEDAAILDYWGYRAGAAILRDDKQRGETLESLRQQVQR